MPTIKGFATEKDTKAYADRIWEKNPKVSPNSWRIIEGCTVGKVGFGSYRVNGYGDQVLAMRDALLSGVNLIDTSSNYMDGQSEKIIGEVLSALVTENEIKREEVMLISKGGYIQGQNLLTHQQNMPEETVQLNEHLWHCIHPNFIAEQLHESLCRLNVETIDGYLLHNPEYFLQHKMMQAGEGMPFDLEEIQNEYYRRIEEAFVCLEEKVKEGKIQFYGISSNTFGSGKEQADHTDLARVFECAQNAAQKAHGRKKRPMFRMIQLPLNLLELDAIKNKNTSAHIFDGKEDVTTLELAARMHLAVLTNRPLNAFPENGGSFRLANHYADIEEERSTSELLEKLKTEEENLNKLVGGWPSAGGQHLFSFTTHGEELLNHIENSVHYDQMQSSFFVPTLALMDHALESLKSQKEEHANELDNIQHNYRKLFLMLMNSIKNNCHGVDEDHLRPVEIEVRDRLPEEWKDAPMQQVALNTVASIPGVSCVLCGLREKHYVNDVTAIYERGDFPDVAGITGA